MTSLIAYIEGIGLLGPGLSGWPEGREILAGRQAYQPQKTVIPPPALLPPAERRRCGEIVKLALATSTEAMATAGVDARNLPSVFTASHGDGHNCHTICEMLASDDRQISPTRFHNSVHNAASGYWSIATGAMAPSAVLCAFDASFGAGLLEALTQVAVDGTRCILIACDTDYPEPFYSVRPLSELLGISLVLAPERTSRTVARISVTLSGERPQTGGLPLDFFHLPLPQGFATRDPLSFDIRTLDGFKLYRIRQTYDANFGTLTGNTPNTLPRYIQFGIRVYF